MNKMDNDKKVEEMINEGIERGIYEETKGKILKKLEFFHPFLYRHLKLHLIINRCYLRGTNQQGLLLQQKHINLTI